MALPPRLSAVDACASALRDAVLSGEWAAGARLPAERALSATFGVNRVTVRGALARLVDEGVLSVRHGHGYVVERYLRSGGLELASAMMRSASPEARAVIVGDLLEARRGLARTVLERLTAHRASRAALRLVTSAVDRLEVLAQGKASPSRLAAADLDVTAAVVGCTGSEVLQLALNPVASTLFELPGLAEAMYATPLDNVASWRLMCAWLEAPKASLVDDLLDALATHDAATLRNWKRRPQ